LQIPYIVTVGEMLSPAARRFLQEQFCGRVYDRYGAEEVGAVAVECSEHNGMHINVESVIVEVVDAQGLPVADGQKGKIIITDLLNFNMPFIRYDTRDTGIVRHDPCPCGLEVPRIWIEGRYSAFLTFDGRAINHLEFDAALDGFMNVIVQYQVAKIADRRVEIRIVPGPSFNSSSKEDIKGKIRT